MLPSPDILNNYEHGKYVLANLAARRAKQLREGAMPLVQVDSPHPLTIALAEIAAGKIKPIMDKSVEAIHIEGADLTLVTDQPVPAEFGMLLPALDEAEVALVSGIEHEEEHETEEIEGEAPADLSGLSIGEDDDEAATAPSEDEPLSLNDIQEQEAADEDEESGD